jgi:hypothetical protein
LLSIKLAGLIETLNKTNNIIACIKISGAYVPVMINETTNNAHFESQI